MSTQKGTLINKYTPNYVIFDLETTGISPNYDEVIEISALKVKGGEVVDEFNYRVTSSSIAGQFTQGLMYSYYGTSVPAGWLMPLTYVRDMAHVRLIVPSKMGHSTAMQSVYPYYYDIRKYQIYR